MAKLDWYRIRVSWIDRQPNSVNGNPRYRVHYIPFDGDTLDSYVFTNALTSSDSAFCYGIENVSFDVDRMVTFTRAGRIDRMVPISEWSE